MAGCLLYEGLQSGVSFGIEWSLPSKQLILSGAISNCPPFFPSSTLDTFQHEGLSFGVTSFCLFIQFMGFSRQEYWSGLPFPPPVDHIFSEPFTVNGRWESGSRDILLSSQILDGDCCHEIKRCSLERKL